MTDRRRAKDLVRRALVGVVCVLLGTTSIVACSSAPRATAAPTGSAVSQLLARHAQAVVARSSSAFVADVDPAPAAQDFRRRQTAEIAALAGVPLHAWTYTINSVVDDSTAVAAAAARLGAPAVIVHVTLQYELSVVDPQPVSHALYWTFVTRGGRAWLAGDSDMADLGGPSWQGIWDFGPVVARRGTASLVLAHPDRSADLTALAQTVDRAVVGVSAVWGTGWARQVAVLVPDSAAELAAVTGQAAPAGAGTSVPGAANADISAETVLEQRPGADGTVSGARIVLNPAALDLLTPTGRDIVVTHEVTHVATAAVTNSFAPKWLVEGFADYVANRGSSQPVGVAAAELVKQVRQGSLPSALPGDTAFQAGAADLPQVYEQSWLACRLIAGQAGAAALVQFYRLVNDAPDPAGAGVTEALQTVLHETLSAFVVAWRAYLRTQAGLS